MKQIYSGSSSEPWQKTTVNKNSGFHGVVIWLIKNKKSRQESLAGFYVMVSDRFIFH
ncbi:MAG: hypothetical protein JW731_07330 [Bacteroidales bacterium]|nr:hypothetical protein [Bacteroidales bacterium]